MDYVYESQPAIIEQDRKLFGKILLIGVALGVIVWGLARVLWQFVLGNIVCDAGQATCVNAHNYAGNIALVVSAIAGVVVLVKAGAYRPVIITLGATVSLWGIVGWLYGASAVLSVLAIVVLYTLAYAVFAWVARIRKAGIMLVIFVLLMALAHILPMVISR